MSQDLYRNQIRELVESVRLEESNVIVRDRKIDLASVETSVLGQQREFVLLRLQQIIYNEFYCGIPIELGGLTDTNDNRAVLGDCFLRRLSQFNNGSEAWDRGWSLETVSPHGLATLAKGGERKFVNFGEFVAADSFQLPLRPGSVVNIYQPREVTQAGNYFYYVLGSKMLPHPTFSNQVRFYWSIEAEGMYLLVSLLTATLNKYRIPFSLKCPSVPGHFARRDAAVLYATASHVKLLCDLISGFYHEVVAHLRPDSPAFTKPLASGLSFAESPKDGESFGMARAKLIAEGLLNAHSEGAKDCDQQLQEVLRTFERLGYDLERLYCNPLSHYPYNFGGFENK